MRVLVVNPPHPVIGPPDRRPPLGGLSTGPLVEAGHDVRIIDAEVDPMPLAEIVVRAQAIAPEAILLGHSGSTSAHPIVAALAGLLRAALPQVWIICGGVFASDHWREFLSETPSIDFIVRGEGGATTVGLLAAMMARRSPLVVPGLAFRIGGAVVGTRHAEIVDRAAVPQDEEDARVCRVGSGGAILPREQGQEEMVRQGRSGVQWGVGAACRGAACRGAANRGAAHRAALEQRFRRSD